MDNIPSMLQQQIEYYRARALEYDEWFLRKGRYDRGAVLNQQWFQEVEQVREALDQFRPCGHILELACGTGLWTQRLLKYARTITAVDAAKEVLALNRERLESPKVKYYQADIFSWQSKKRYDIIFFGFWLSHVPKEYFKPFWEKVRQWLKTDGRIFFVDSKYEPTSTARDQSLGNVDGETVLRRLRDGRTYQIVKVFYKGKPLEKRLGRMGWRIKVRETPHYFIYGYGGAVTRKEFSSN